MLFQFNLESIKHVTQDTTPQHHKDVTRIVNPKTCFKNIERCYTCKIKCKKKNPLNLATKFP